MSDYEYTDNDSGTEDISRRERGILLVSVLVIAICALTYELIVGTLSSYLLGNSVAQFSFTIGLFLFAMGIGSLLSRRIKGHELRWFIIVELIIGLMGGFSATILYAVFAATDIYYYTVMVVLILVIGSCIGLEIPLLTRIVARRKNGEAVDISHALADVLSVDYLGSLVAALAFPIVLLPALGVTLTAFLTGLLNMAVAGLNLYLFRGRLLKGERRWLWMGTLAAGILMAGGAMASGSVTEFFEDRLYEDRVIYREQSPYQRIVMTRDGSDVRLFLDGQIQFSSRDEYRYHEMLVHPVMGVARSHERIAILGGGDGLVVRELLKYDDVREIVLIDLDPAVTRLAQENPILLDLNGDSLSDPRVTIVNQDAYNYIVNDDTLFNVVIIDLPDPNNESLSKLYSETFYRLLQKRLTPDGAFVTQATSPYFAREAFWCIATTIEASGYHIVPLHVSVPAFGEWGFVIGTPVRPPDVRIPDAVAEDLKFLTPEGLLAAQYFDPDIDKSGVHVDVNTLDNPVLLRYYERGWQHWN